MTAHGSVPPSCKRRAVTLVLGLDEIWAIRDFVRQLDKLGQEWDKDFQRRLYAAMAVAKADENRQAPFIVESEDELWQITRQIPSTLMVGTQPVGRNLLEKAQAALLEWVPVSDDDEPTKEALPGFIVAFQAERDAAEQGFVDWGNGS